MVWFISDHSNDNKRNSKKFSIKTGTFIHWVISNILPIKNKSSIGDNHGILIEYFEWVFEEYYSLRLTRRDNTVMHVAAFRKRDVVCDWLVWREDLSKATIVFHYSFNFFSRCFVVLSQCSPQFSSNAVIDFWIKHFDRWFSFSLINSHSKLVHYCSLHECHRGRRRTSLQVWLFQAIKLFISSNHSSDHRNCVTKQPPIEWYHGISR